MKEATPPTPKANRKRKKPVEPREILDNTKISIRAMVKLQNGEKISETELFALYKSHTSEYDLDIALKALAEGGDTELLKSISNLYVERPEIASNFAGIWCPNLEEEMLAYFRRHPDQLYSLHPRKFEELVAAIFKNNGFTVQLTPETKDGGVDIIAVQHSAFTGETVSLIECKRYSPTQKVGIGIVQRLIGAVYQMQATKGVIVTTSFFSRDAHQAAQSCKHMLALKDYFSIQSWLRELPFAK